MERLYKKETAEKERQDEIRYLEDFIARVERRNPVFLLRRPRCIRQWWRKVNNERRWICFKEGGMIFFSVMSGKTYSADFAADCGSISGVSSKQIGGRGMSELFQKRALTFLAETDTLRLLLPNARTAEKKNTNDFRWRSQCLVKCG